MNRSTDSHRPEALSGGITTDETPEEAADAKVGQLLSDADVPLSADESMAEGICELLDERLRDADVVPLMSSGVVHARLMALATENIVKIAAETVLPTTLRERLDRELTEHRTARGSTMTADARIVFVVARCRCGRVIRVYDGEPQSSASYKRGTATATQAVDSTTDGGIPALRARGGSGGEIEHEAPLCELFEQDVCTGPVSLNALRNLLVAARAYANRTGEPVWVPFRLTSGAGLWLPEVDPEQHCCESSP